MKSKEAIDPESIVETITSIVEKLYFVKKKYKIELNHAPDIIDALEIIIDGLEKLNNEIFIDSKYIMDKLLLKLRKHYKNYDHSQSIAKIEELYKKYFPE